MNQQIINSLKELFKHVIVILENVLDNFFNYLVGKFFKKKVISPNQVPPEIVFLLESQRRSQQASDDLFRTIVSYRDLRASGEPISSSSTSQSRNWYFQICGATRERSAVFPPNPDYWAEPPPIHESQYDAHCPQGNKITFNAEGEFKSTGEESTSWNNESDVELDQKLNSLK